MRSTEKERAYKRAWYVAHREEHKARVAAYSAAHLEERAVKNRAYHKAYRAAHRDELRAQDAANYLKYREERRGYAAATRARANAWRAAAKASGCVDCGIKDVRVLDFDHVRGHKLANIGALRNIARLEAEAAKCEVRCANCHRIRTIERRLAKTA